MSLTLSKDTTIYRGLRWVCSHPAVTFGRQRVLIVMLWRMRALSEDRTQLKQRVRKLESDLADQVAETKAFREMLPKESMVTIPVQTLDRLTEMALNGRA